MAKVSYFRLVRQKLGPLFPLFFGGASLACVFVYGFLVFYWGEGWTPLESFYQVVITLSTVGFHEVHPLSERGQILTSLLILLGVGNFAYLVGAFSQILVDGTLQEIIKQKRLRRMLAKKENHFIVCGFGRIGSVVALEILKEGHAVVVIEQDEQIVERLKLQGIDHIHGDATIEKNLVLANIKKAKALITALNDEAKNVYVVLTARQLAPDLPIIARADHETTIPKLKLAGATKVMTPHLIGGIRMAQTVLKPNVTDFVDLAMQDSSLDLQMEELIISEKSTLAGKDLIQSQIRPNYNLIIIAIKKKDGQMVFNPGPKTIIEARDTLIAVGSKENLRRIEEIL